MCVKGLLPQHIRDLISKKFAYHASKRTVLTLISSVQRYRGHCCCAHQLPRCSERFEIGPSHGSLRTERHMYVAAPACERRVGSNPPGLQRSLLERHSSRQVYDQGDSSDKRRLGLCTRDFGRHGDDRSCWGESSVDSGIVCFPKNQL